LGRERNLKRKKTVFAPPGILVAAGPPRMALATADPTMPLRGDAMVTAVEAAFPPVGVTLTVWVPGRSFFDESLIERVNAPAATLEVVEKSVAVLPFFVSLTLTGDAADAVPVILSVPLRVLPTYEPLMLALESVTDGAAPGGGGGGGDTGAFPTRRA
jgi:hypothetical protein